MDVFLYSKFGLMIDQFVCLFIIHRYTSFSDLLPLLAIGKVPQLVKVDEISQAIDSTAFTVQNCVKFKSPLASTSLTTNAKFEIRSPKRVQVPNQSIKQPSANYDIRFCYL